MKSQYLKHFHELEYLEKFQFASTETFRSLQNIEFGEIVGKKLGVPVAIWCMTTNEEGELRMGSIPMSPV